MMKRVLLLILAVIPLLGYGQRMELYTYNNFKYIALYSYGLPREVVKTNAEMKASQMNEDGTGVMKRHHTTKGVDESIGEKGYNANDKISFAFMIAPRNVKADGTETTDSEDVLSWAVASGWDESINDGSDESTLAPTPTGCAAYRGMNNTDNPGDWRLPTQREIQIMFTVIEQSLGYINSNAVDHEITEGVYWSSTEFFAGSSTSLYAWSISSITGQPVYDLKNNCIVYPDFEIDNNRMARCVKDIYEPINE